MGKEKKIIFISYTPLFRSTDGPCHVLMLKLMCMLSCVCVSTVRYHHAPPGLNVLLLLTFWYEYLAWAREYRVLFKQHSQFIVYVPCKCRYAAFLFIPLLPDSDCFFLKSSVRGFYIAWRNHFFFLYCWDGLLRHYLLFDKFLPQTSHACFCHSPDGKCQLLKFPYGYWRLFFFHLISSWSHEFLRWLTFDRITIMIIELRDESRFENSFMIDATISSELWNACFWHKWCSWVKFYWLLSEMQ